MVKRSSYIAKVRAKLSEAPEIESYAVDPLVATEILDEIYATEPSALSLCEEFNVDLSEIVWDIATAVSWRNFASILKLKRSRSKDGTKKTAKRLPPMPDTPDDNLKMTPDLEKFIAARVGYLNKTDGHLRAKHVAEKFSHAPGIPFTAHKRGRREDQLGKWLVTKIDGRLRTIKKLSAVKRNEILCSLLQISDFLYSGKPTNTPENLDAPSTLIRKLTRIRTMATRAQQSKIDHPQKTTDSR